MFVSYLTLNLDLDQINQNVGEDFKLTYCFTSGEGRR